MFAGPFTHWGGLATWNVGPRLSVDAGIVNGWDSLDRVSDDPAFIGRVTLKDECDLWSLSFGLITGNEDIPALTDSLNNSDSSASNVCSSGI